jgi:hypothetical protein
VHDHGVGFELWAPSEALRQLADAFSGEVLSAEITPDDGSVLIIRVTAGPVVISHDGVRVEIVGGREALDELAVWLRFAADGPQVPSTVRYHVHIEHYPGHPWLAPASEPVVVTLSDWQPPAAS